MTDFKIDKLGFYKTRAGDKVEVIYTDRIAPMSVVYISNKSELYLTSKCGTQFPSSECSADIISEWVEPAPRRKVTLKKYLVKYCDTAFYETDWRTDKPNHIHIEIGSKEVELPEGW